MGAAWKKKTNPDLIFDRYREISSLTNDNRVQFSGFEGFELDAQLNRIIEYGENFSFHTKKSLRDKALRACIKSNKINKDEFKKELNKEISIYKTITDKEYILTTSLSLADGLPIKRIKLPDAVIQSHEKGLPKKYQGRATYIDRWNELFKGESPIPDSYTAVTIKVKAKSPEDAADMALNNLDLVRGILGFHVNPSGDFSFLFGTPKTKPINKITLGGMHALHSTNGKLILKDSFWFEPNYKERPTHTISKERLPTIKKSITIIIEGINKYQDDDRETLTSAIIRYARALDDQDRNVIIQKLWATIESIVTPNESNCDKIAKRCSFLFKESKYVSEVLEGIRGYRNQYVHAGISEDEIDSHCYQLQNFLRSVIFFYISKASFFKSLNEAREFLDSPEELKDINKSIEMAERKVELLKLARKFREGPQIKASKKESFY